MDIAQTASTALAATPPGAGNARQLVTSDFETFLTLLTTQIRNQDPLDPVSSEDFATQLATFSGVEQQVRGNTLLEDIAARLGAGDVAGLAGWIGLELRGPVAARFGDTPVTVQADVPDDAASARLLVRDAAGEPVAAVPLAPGTAEVTWPAPGETQPPAGIYRFEVEITRTGEPPQTRPAEVYARVTEARLGPAGPELVLDGGDTLRPDQATALRRPPDASVQQ